MLGHSEMSTQCTGSCSSSARGRWGERPFRVQTLRIAPCSSAARRRKDGCLSDTASFSYGRVYLKHRRSSHNVGLSSGVPRNQLWSSSSDGPGSALLGRPDSDHSNGNEQQHNHHQHSWKRPNAVKVAAFVSNDRSFAIKLFLAVLLLLPAEPHFPLSGSRAPRTRTAPRTQPLPCRAALALPDPSN